HEERARAGQHALELRDLAQELPVLAVTAETHHPLDARPVVPGPVEQRDLAAGGQMSHVALEVPLASFALARCRQGDDRRTPGVQVLHEALDRAALTGGIAALEEHDQLPTRVPQPRLSLQQLDLEIPLLDLLLG